MLSVKPKIAIVHDVLDQYGGAERVVEALLEIWPEADVYTSRYQPKPALEFLNRHKVTTSFMQNLPFFSLFAKFYTPLYPLAFESFDLTRYDVVISSTAHFAKAVLTTPRQLHICYCHTPPRFMYHYPSESQTRRHSIFKPLVMILDHLFRQYDFKIAQRPDVMIANSKEVQHRIKKFYRRDAHVIHPPVAVAQIQEAIKSHMKRRYYLVVSRLVAYKNIGTVIKAFKDLPNDQLIIVGIGPEKEELQANSGNNVEFRGFIKDEDLPNLYANAKALIFSASNEDFGIVPVEAMAAGTPVIVLESGGVLETVIDGQTGVFYHQNTPESLKEAISLANQVEFNEKEIRERAKIFGKEVFRDKIQSIAANN